MSGEDVSRNQWRGHDFWPPDDQLAEMPRLYGTEAVPLAEKLIKLHYFVGACDWWLVEYDPAERIGWGYACLGDPQCAEWGYVPLDELEAIFRPPHFISAHAGVSGMVPPLIVERDLYWTPRPVKEVKLPGRAH